jgi:putative ABC transport system substrate-binding protein
MAELGYVEGKDVKYIYNGVIENETQIIDDEIKKLLSEGVDLLLTVANIPTVEAKKITEGTGTPVLGASCVAMEEIGLVKSRKYPGGNITGVQVTITAAKAFEWLTTIAPGIKRVYLPYNPDENVENMFLSELNKTASYLGVEIVLDKVHKFEEAISAIEDPSRDIDAVFIIPSHTLDQGKIELSQAAIKRTLPMGAALPLYDDAIVSFGSEPFEIGKQTARLAHQIRNGSSPSDLPVEAAEVFLTLNIGTAEKIGLEIPDDVLVQANRIIR